MRLNLTVILLLMYDVSGDVIEVMGHSYHRVILYKVFF